MAPSPAAAATRLMDPLAHRRRRKFPPARLQEQPPRPCRRVEGNALPSEDEAVVVQRQLTLQPAGMGLRPDEDGEGPGLNALAPAGLVVLDDDLFEHVIAQQLAYLTMPHDVNRGVALDSVHQVAGHVLAQVAAADHEPDPGGVLGDEQAGLTRRVTASDDDNRVAAAPVGLELRGRVIHADPFEAFQAGHLEFAVAGTGGDQDRAARQVDPSSSSTR